MTEQGYPEWIDDLVESHPRTVLPVVRRAIREEYASPAGGMSAFIYRYGRGTQAIHPAIQKILFDLIASKEPVDINKFDSMVGMVERINLESAERKRLFKIAENRLVAHQTAARIGESRWYLALLLILDFRKGLTHLENWLNGAAPEQAQENAEQTFAFLFDRHNPTIPSALSAATVQDIEGLLRLVYAHVSPELDQYHEGSYTPNTRDHAENARNTILAALLDRPGPDAYDAMRRAADDPAFTNRSARFHELARGKAERDAELLAWTPKEVMTFKRERTAPVKVGADLLRVVEAVLRDIKFQFAKGDASSRRVLSHALNEDEVQNWLVEQLNLRSRDRYRAFREAEVAIRDKPDVIIASSSAPCEVAVEVKQSKRWTLRQLHDALRIQLAEDYLKPEARRHGVLVITHHRVRRWRDTETNELLTFDALIERLSKDASTILRNTSGVIEVKCVGIDSSDASPVSA
jgi:hypothetical protein